MVSRPGPADYGGVNMPFRRGRFRRNNKRSRVRIVIFMIFVAIILMFAWFNIALVPVLKTSATYKAKVLAINTINNAVGEVLEKDNITYDKLMTFEKDTNGDITALNANTIQINLLKYDIVKEVINEISAVGGSEIKIPIGTVVGGQLFTGRGPNIHIRFLPIGNVDSEITSTFSSAGINQTRQQIMLNVKVDLTVLISSYNVSTHVENNFCIADSVIVGSVPGSYTVVDGTNGTSDKLFIYGQNGSNSGSSSK